jgi:glycosyltransferase involved in cell wall biosynthesis
VDDGSTDNTKELLKKYIRKKQINYVCQKNKGQAVARNRGIKLSRGELIAFLDADDVWSQKKLELQISRFKDKEVSLVYGNVLFQNGKSEKVSPFHKKFKRGYAFEELLIQNFICISAAIIRKKVLYECGLFDHKLRISPDYNLWLRVAKKHKMDYVPEIIGKRRLHGKNIVFNREIFIKNTLQIKKEICDKFKVSKKLKKNSLHNSYFDLSYCLTENKEYIKAIKALSKAFFSKPLDYRNYKLLAKIILHS